MKILSFGHSELSVIPPDTPYLILESQNYGSPDDRKYHVLVNDANGNKLIRDCFIREIEDKGRTSGFWQNVGGSGVYAVHAVALQGFSPKLTDIISRRAEATLSFTGKTWKEIVTSMPFADPVREQLGFNEDAAPAKKTTKRTSKKRATKATKVVNKEVRGHSDPSIN